MKKWINHIASGVAACFAIFSLVVLIQASAPFDTDEKKQLQNKIDQLKVEIQQMEKQIDVSEQKKKESLEHLQSINSKINTREELIVSLGQQAQQYVQDSIETAAVIIAMEQDLNALKQSYGDLMYYAYQNKLEDNALLFVFSADSYNDAFKRFLYLQKMADFRHEQADLIAATIVDLEEKVASLQESMDGIKVALGEQQSQKTLLAQEKASQDQLISSLNADMQQIQNDIDGRKPGHRAIEHPYSGYYRRRDQIGAGAFEGIGGKQWWFRSGDDTPGSSTVEGVQ